MADPNSEHSGRAKVGKMDVGANLETAMRYHVRGVPTVLLFKNGRVVEQRTGAVGKADLQKMIEPHIGQSASRLRRYCDAGARGAPFLVQIFGHGILAVDAIPRPGQRAETLGGDRVAAGLADSEIAGIEAAERFVHQAELQIVQAVPL